MAYLECQRAVSTAGASEPGSSELPGARQGTTETDERSVEGQVAPLRSSVCHHTLKDVYHLAYSSLSLSNHSFLGSGHIHVARVTMSRAQFSCIAWCSEQNHDVFANSST